MRVLMVWNTIVSSFLGNREDKSSRTKHLGEPQTKHPAEGGRRFGTGAHHQRWNIVKMPTAINIRNKITPMISIENARFS